MNYRHLLIGTLLLSIAIFGAGFCIGKGFYLSRLSNRMVTVKGLTEKNVTSDLGVWEVRYREVGSTITELYQNLQNDQSKVMAFLNDHGFKAEEISAQPIQLQDRLANAYQSSDDNSKSPLPRYVLTGGLLVRSSQVQLIQNTNQMLGTLLAQGIPLTMDSTVDPNPSYYFTKLDAMRPPMMSEAIKSARSVAEQFAKDAHAGLGNIQKANQGVFQLATRDSTFDGNNYQNPNSTIEKKIRLVATIDYQLR